MRSRAGGEVDICIYRRRRGLLNTQWGEHHQRKGQKHRYVFTAEGVLVSAAKLAFGLEAGTMEGFHYQEPATGFRQESQLQEPGV